MALTSVSIQMRSLSKPWKAQSVQAAPRSPRIEWKGLSRSVFLRTPRARSRHACRRRAAESVQLDAQTFTYLMTETSFGQVLALMLLAIAGGTEFALRNSDVREAYRTVLQKFELLEKAQGPQVSQLTIELQEAATRLARYKRLKPETYVPSALQSRSAVLQGLRAFLPAEVRGLALEVGSFPGAHVELLGAAFPGLTWQPSDVHAVGSPQLLQVNENGIEVHDNVEQAVSLDASQDWSQWPNEVTSRGCEFRLVFTASIQHCTCWAVTRGLIAGAAQCLQRDGHLVIHGPFIEKGRYASVESALLDASLRLQGEDQGLRDVQDLSAEALKFGLVLQEQRDMPSNSLMLFFQKKYSRPLQQY